MTEQQQQQYEKRTKEAIEQFLESPFIAYRPFEKSDEQILHDAKRRADINTDGGLLNEMQSWPHIVTYEKDVEYEYFNKYMAVHFVRGNGLKPLVINHSDFTYGGLFHTGDIDSFEPSCVQNNLVCQCTVDDKVFSPSYFSRGLHKDYLLAYGFEKVNSYSKIRKCYRFYSLTGNNSYDAAIIRKQILRAQAFCLLLLVKYPSLACPCYNWEGIGKEHCTIMKNSVKTMVNIIRQKLSCVETTLRQHGFTYEHGI